MHFEKQQKACSVTQATISNFLPHFPNKISQRSTKGEIMESNEESSPHLCTSESLSNHITLPVELSSKSKQDF